MQELLDPNWNSRCVFCGELLTYENIDRGEVILSVIPQGIDVLCTHHIVNESTYHRAIVALAKAISKRLPAKSQTGFERRN